MFDQKKYLMYMCNLKLNCRSLVGMQHLYFMALRKLMKGRQHSCNEELLISPSFIGDLDF